MSLVFILRFRFKALGAFAAPVTFLVIGYAAMQSKEVRELMPALRSGWLGLHVSTAIIAYGSFGVCFVLSLIFLLRARVQQGSFLDQHLPDREKLDAISYRASALGLLFLTFTILSGAIWAERAWGSYWSWDPKETWSLVTWIVYAAYLHLRLRRGYILDYLEQDPYLVNIYEGFGFSKEYGSARGHSYTLEDVAATQRPHPKANCLTCKTPNLAKMVQDQGVGVYSMPFDEVMALMEEDVSCYTCHGNDAGSSGKLTVTHTYVTTALDENASAIDPATLSCGQCHIEYYFTPSDSETMMPYHSVAEMTPEAIYAYYEAMGFSDWTQPSTGTKLLKAQHPEMETFLQGKHAALVP